MGTNIAQHHQASLKAPIKAALIVAENALVTLIRDGPIAYADDLEREAEVASRGRLLCRTPARLPRRLRSTLPQQVEALKSHDTVNRHAPR